MNDLGPAGKRLEIQTVGVTDSFALFWVDAHFGDSFLLASDGTQEGTYVVRELEPSNWTYDFASTGSRVFFSLSHPEFGRELWTSDGTPEGTGMVRDIFPGPLDGDPERMVAAHGRVYFCAVDPEHGFEFWSSDGTLEGTRMLVDFNPGSPSSSPGRTVPIGDGVVVVADDGESGTELWYVQKDGDFSFEVMDIRQEETTESSLRYSSPIVAQDGFVVFPADDGRYGRELWKSSGSDQDTRMIRDLSRGAEDGDPTYLASLDGRSFWSALSDRENSFPGDRTGQLFIVDDDGVMTDITQFENSTSYVHSAVAGSSGILFNVNIDSLSNTVWFTDGSPEGTSMIHAPETTENRTGSGAFGYVNDVWLIATTRPGLGLGIYAWNGSWSAEGNLTADVTAEIVEPSTRTRPTVLDSELLFVDQENRAWVTDGTTAGTQRIDFPDGEPRQTDEMEIVNGKVVLPGALDGDVDLFSYDGKTGTTRLLSGSLPHENGAWPRNFATDGNRMFFSIKDWDGRMSIWKTDGTSTGTVELIPFTDWGYHEFLPLVFHDGRLLFGFGNDDYGNELWISDGRAEGTFMVADINPGSDGSWPENGALLDDLLIFSAVGEGIGRELWSIDLSSITTSNENPVSLPGNVSIGAVWPNPVTDTATLAIDAPIPQHVSIEAFDVLGRRVGRVYSGLVGRDSRSQIDIDAAGWAAGMYLLRVEGESFSTTRTLIRAH
jgi:ELWxxDGT repeat protein